MPNVFKITPGFVSQEFDTQTNKCVNQVFVAGDQCDWESADGEPVAALENAYCPMLMEDPEAIDIHGVDPQELDAHIEEEARNRAGNIVNSPDFAMRWLERLTPEGSEFRNDPWACFKYVHGERSCRLISLKKYVAEVKDLRRSMAQLLEAQASGNNQVVKGDTLTLDTTPGKVEKPDSKDPLEELSKKMSLEDMEKNPIIREMMDEFAVKLLRMADEEYEKAYQPKPDTEEND